MDDVTESDLSDLRLLKGARSRQTIARHAAEVATVEGLNGVSIGRLAADLGISKSGVATLFGTKENLQVAAVDAARAVFREYVVTPNLDKPEGIERLRAVLESWIEFLAGATFPGGCFRAANIGDFDSRPGPVHDALQRDYGDWQAFLARQLRVAKQAGDVRADIDPELEAFHIDAVGTAANFAMRAGDTDAPHKIRRIIDRILA